MKIGYARVSTADQELGRQIADLEKYGCDVIYQEKISGKLAKRPELDKMLEALKAGDIVVIHKLDRLGRSLKHLIDLVQTFKVKQVDFISLNDNFNTTTSQGKLIFNIMGSIAEFERDMISERTKSGLAFIRSTGVKLGRPDKSKDQMIIDSVVSMKGKGQNSIASIARKCRISVPTVYKILNNNITD